jgi:hypothetical protein
MDKLVYGVKMVDGRIIRVKAESLEAAKVRATMLMRREVLRAWEVGKDWDELGFMVGAVEYTARLVAPAL